MERIRSDAGSIAMKAYHPTATRPIRENAFAEKGEIRDHDIEESMGSEHSETLSQESLSVLLTQMVEQMDHANLLGVIIMKG